MYQQSDLEIERAKARSNARNFGAVVYVGGTVAATVLFITFILSAFPPDAYLSRTIMTLAGLAVGASMLAFPVAMHNWVVTKEHRTWGTFLYYGEMLIITVNTVVSFVTLLAEYAGYTPPAWTVLYEPFSVASIIYTVFAWGTLFLVDPDHKAYAAEKEADERLQKKIALKREKYLDTAEGEELASQMAAAEIAQRWTTDKHLRSKGLLPAESPIPAPSVFQKKESQTDAPKKEGDVPLS